MNSPAPSPAQSRITIWVIWIAILQGLFFIIFFAADGFPSGEDQGPLPWGMGLIGLSGFFVGSIIRWVVIPKLTTFAKLMPAFVIGLAACEFTGIFALFVINADSPTMQAGLLICSLIGILQFVPTFTVSFKE